MTQDAKPLTVEEIEVVRRHAGCTDYVCERSKPRECEVADEYRSPKYLLAVIDQQAKQIECGECGNPKGFAVLCADCWSHYYRSMVGEASAVPSDETPTIAYWRRNAHEALDAQIAAMVECAINETLDSITDRSIAAANVDFNAQQVVNHVTNARLAAARSEKA